MKKLIAVCLLIAPLLQGCTGIARLFGLHDARCMTDHADVCTGEQFPGAGFTKK